MENFITLHNAHNRAYFVATARIIAVVPGDEFETPLTRVNIEGYGWVPVTESPEEIAAILGYNFRPTSATGKDWPQNEPISAH